MSVRVTGTILKQLLWYVLTLSVFLFRETNINFFLTLFIQNEQDRFQEWMCLKRRPKKEDRRLKTLWSKTKTLWSKTKTLWSKTKTHQSKISKFFSIKERGKEGKTVSATNLTVTLSQSVQRVSNCVTQLYSDRNIICHDDLVCFVVTNILFLKCISENYDEVTLLPSYILSLSY